ncbi:ABC transporter permease [Chitinophaga japonensis]|uniref:Lipoprotein-releasing system permease protein n=1 Tax=Chitinophaga japonensis TaxID=104662 RepID=A0A562T3P7_CHIJA|nr:FtsX-like permease family protein [Chitinophaga japonensis]TWI88169.1 lipoprotein-releasing system permease protein [Chitinophaga japonensis]
MRLSFFIARRIAFNRGSSFSRFIINIAIIATAISVAVMILATALVNGFQQVIQEKIFSFWGHIHVTQYQPNAGPLTEQIPFNEDTVLVQRLRQVPGVTIVNAYATKSAILKADKDIEGIIFKGVDARYDWQHLQRFLVAGRPIQYNDSSYAGEIIISRSTAQTLQLQLNDKVIVYFIQGGGQPPRARKLTVTGIYKTGIEEYDKTYIIGDINLVQRLNNWDAAGIGGYEVFVSDYRQMTDIAWSIDSLIPQKLFVRTIRDIYPNIFDWLQLQNKNEVIILVIMTIVAIINMITAILILILERTNMTGILKALGMRNWSVQKIFIYQAGYIVLAGLLLGNLLGLGIAFLQQTTGFFKLPEESYYMSVAAIDLHWWEVALINVCTFAICICVLLVPSLIIRRITPVKAIQFK